MKILFAASEGVPFCKTGGLADVVGGLSDALAGGHHTVRAVLPLYREIREHVSDLQLLPEKIEFVFNGRRESLRLFEKIVKPRLSFVFVDAPAFFDRPGGLYGPTPGHIFDDNDQRYALFSRAVPEVAKALNFKPAILHCHDWQTGLVPAYLRFLYADDPFFSKTATVFTIHNMAYQGNFPATILTGIGFPTEALSIQGLEYYGQVSYLKSGLVYSNEINTVSPTYAEEIRTDPDLGGGMQGVLQSLGPRFRGILNRLDVKAWDPKKDSFLARRYDSRKLFDRAECKLGLQKAAGLVESVEVPLFGFIGRLDRQKGVDLIIEIAPTLLGYGAQLITLGQGHPDYVTALKSLQERFPSQVFSETRFAESFAHKIYAGVDMFLMPSRFEPCGLGQLIAMRYGAVPIVTPTGGLKDTVDPIFSRSEGTGFVSADGSAGAFLSSTLEALSLLKDVSGWRSLQRRGMMSELGWKVSVPLYETMYEDALDQRRS